MSETLRSPEEQLAGTIEALCETYADIPDATVLTIESYKSFYYPLPNDPQGFIPVAGAMFYKNKTETETWYKLELDVPGTIGGYAFRTRQGSGMVHAGMPIFSDEARQKMLASATLCTDYITDLEIAGQLQPQR